MSTERASIIEEPMEEPVEESGVLRAATAAVRTFGDITPALVHDLKGPLSSITMNVEFALDQLGDDAASEPVRGALEDCRSAASRLFRMISNLLDVARCEEGRLRPQCGPVAVQGLLADVVDGYTLDASMRRIDMSVEVEEGVEVVECDADLLTRVLQSIVDNALRHTRPRGHVVVIAREDAEQGELILRVANDGAPMPPAVRAGLFNRSLGTESHGAGANRGLGLYFCRLATEAMGGSIAVADERGYAVCFELRLPLGPRRSSQVF